jgi:DNA processing protein
MPPERDEVRAGQGEPCSEQRATNVHACAACLARSALLGMLSVRIEYAARDPSRLLDLLQLPDEQLIDAIGGRRRQDLSDRREALLAGQLSSSSDSSLCRHAPMYRRIFGDRLAVAGALHVVGDLRHLRRIDGEPVVAIVGTTKASDYGMEMAASLARGLAICDVRVLSSFTAGIGAAAHLGVLEADAAALAVMPGGIDRPPACLARLLRRLTANGAAISELPRDFRPRRWSARACERVLAALADLVVVIEADVHELGMLTASLAASRGVAVAAMPGRITSPAARGPHALLRGGARLLTSVQDALDLLHRMSVPRPTDPRLQLTPQAMSLLQRIGAGQDTLQSICLGPHREAMLTALGELRCKGLLARGDGGRYLPKVSLDMGLQRSIPQQPGEKQSTANAA